MHITLAPDVKAKCHKKQIYLTHTAKHSSEITFQLPACLTFQMKRPWAESIAAMPPGSSRLIIDTRAKSSRWDTLCLP